MAEGNTWDLLHFGHNICYIALHSAYIVHYMHKEAPDSAPFGSLGSVGSVGSARLRSAPLKGSWRGVGERFFSAADES